MIHIGKLLIQETSVTQEIVINIIIDIGNYFLLRK
jgi:hypothetical protein